MARQALGLQRRGRYTAGYMLGLLLRFRLFYAALVFSRRKMPRRFLTRICLLSLRLHLVDLFPPPPFEARVA